MSRTCTLGRASTQLLTSSTPTIACRLPRTIPSQQRQLQTSANRQGVADRVKSLFGGKKKEQEKTEVVKSAPNYDSPAREPDLPGWYLPAEKLRKGWAKTPEEDSKYVIATEGKDLDHVGSDKWLEKQFDDKGKYKGWARLKKANGLHPNDASARVIQAAADVLAHGPKQHRKELEERGLDMTITNAQQKFRISKILRAATSMQIPDAVLDRATTLRDFHRAILSKPKPKKLSLELLGNKELMANPNLQVRGGRQTPVHKERAVGRWKLIETELENKGLPIFGHGLKAQRTADKVTQAA